MWQRLLSLSDYQTLQARLESGHRSLLSIVGPIAWAFDASSAIFRWAGIEDYKTKSEEIYHKLHSMNPEKGLYPIYVQNKGHASFAGSKVSFGAMGDSFYEYMLKVWIQGGKVEQEFRDMYDESIQGMFEELLHLSEPSELVFIADRENRMIDKKQDHLVCFMGGLLALGAYTDPRGLNSERAQRDLKTAKVRDSS